MEAGIAGAVPGCAESPATVFPFTRLRVAPRHTGIACGDSQERDRLPVLSRENRPQGDSPAPSRGFQSRGFHKLPPSASLITACTLRSFIMNVCPSGRTTG